jgi:predicted flavoprotein YhiN
LRDAIERDGRAVLRVDLRPDLGEAALARRLARPQPGQSMASVLRKAAGLPPVAAGLLREAAGLALPREPERLAALIKAAPLLLTAPQSLERAISTAGGIALQELDERLMLRARPGVFVAGEMLDWEAPTGGYLLQAVLATGVAAANGVLAWLGRPEAAG